MDCLQARSKPIINAAPNAPEHGHLALTNVSSEMIIQASLPVLPVKTTLPHGSSLLLYHAWCTFCSRSTRGKPMHMPFKVRQHPHLENQRSQEPRVTAAGADVSGT